MTARSQKIKSISITLSYERIPIRGVIVLDSRLKRLTEQGPS